ncbi:MAG: mycofactocin biosynthesis glycosyltransferase MftF [Acidobacteria bacterium]|nr:mycofactocin biosynthesis glycosyltransferase MftF [Acidobacteriota bacterium]
MRGPRWVVDRTWRRTGTVLEAGSPLRVFRTSAAGLATLERLEHGLDPLPADAPLVDRLVDAGAIHPLVEPDPDRLRATTVVIPARVADARDAQRLARLVAALAPVPTIVISDASPHRLPDIACRTIVRGVRGGPGAARNTGLAEVETPFVAFVDLDVRATADDLASLLGHFDDPRTVLVAPRVRSLPRDGALARYERARSPLDRGPDDGLIRPASRVPWVPAALLVCRTAEVRDAGGFDPSLQAGEDVDLVWRLGDAGWRCRYAPDVECGHEPRSDVPAFVAQRFRDGRSTAPLALLHRSRLAPIRMSRSEAAWWCAAAAWTPVALLAGLAAATVRLSRRLGERGVPRESLRLATAAQARTARHVARALTRPWLPALLVAAIVSRRARGVLAAAALLPALVDWWRTKPGLDPARFVALSVLDDASHAAGIAAGALAHRTAAPFLPDLHGAGGDGRATAVDPAVPVSPSVAGTRRYGGAA